MGSIENDLNVVNQPLPMRGSKEDELLAELLDELEPSTRASRDDEAEILVITPSSRLLSNRTMIPRAGWYAATAAALLLVLVSLNGIFGLQRLDPAQQAAATIESACRSFAEAAPPLGSIDRQLAEEPPEVNGLDEYVNSFQTVVDAIDRLAATDLPIQTRRELSVIGGYLRQAQLSATQGGPPPSTPLRSANQKLRSIAEADRRFRGCSP